MERNQLKTVQHLAAFLRHDRGSGAQAGVRYVSYAMIMPRGEGHASFGLLAFFLQEEQQAHADARRVLL